ncbi:hypothetical protein GP486_000925 [Trichoglossum hirsutum]|uniref:NACHT domain-containing protein n=1 Tax=Trichoglossum hirsutum TaxID=265104 RepID=A0A9P8LHW2_9PEZI|nr:hypothetical protein GP486_000925 [Trichoglossum hirsutum]
MGPYDKVRQWKRNVFRSSADKASGSKPIPNTAPILTDKQIHNAQVRDLRADALQTLTDKGEATALQSSSAVHAYSDSDPDILTELADRTAEYSDRHVQVRNLWADALETLSSEDEAAILQSSSISQAPDSKLGILQHLCAIAEQKRDDCEKRGWKFELNGRQIILRDVAQKVIVWVNKFKEVSDVTANFDPMGALLIGVERVAYLINRCEIYEALYLRDEQSRLAVKHLESAEANPEPVVKNLESALVTLYAAMLRFLATASRLYDKSFSTRSFHGILKPDEVASFVDESRTLEIRVDIEANNCERTYCRVAHAKLGERGERFGQLLVDLQEPIMRVDSGVAALHERLNESERSEILTWVSGIPYEDNHYTARKGRTDGTGEWLLRHERYRGWRGFSASTILWLHGIPGAGKTKLVSTVVDDLLDGFKQHSNDEALAYFYCDRNEFVRQDPELILSSFVRQLSISRNGDAIQRSVVQLYHQKQKTGFASGKLKIEESRDVLLQLVRIYPQTTLVLDALDECNKETRTQLVDILDTLVTQAPKPVKVFISSRPDQDIKHRFECGPNVQIRATDNRDDIAKFVDHKINNSPGYWQKSISPDLKKGICETLVDKSEGMQIVQLLKLQPRERDIRERLGKLPNSLDKAYDEIYVRIQAQEGSAPKIADRAFQWVMCSCTPLSPAELVAAVCQDPYTDVIDPVDIGIDIVLAACHNLLVVDQQLWVCRFSHLSVQEYFENRHWNQSQANSLVAKVCLSLLNDPIHRELDPRHINGQDRNDSTNPVMQYARFHWATHTQRHGEESIDSRLATLLKRFLGSMNESGPAYRIWYHMIAVLFQDKPYNIPLYNIYRKLRPPLVASFAICVFGFHKILSDWWISGFANVDRENQEGESLLGLAVAGGFASITEELLTKGVDVNVQGGGFGSALQTASYRGHDQIVQWLLEKGADVNAQGVRHSNALQAASYKGHGQIVQRLLEGGADVNMQGGHYGNALQAASAGGHDQIVQRLLEKGAEVNMQGGDYGNALQAASARGHNQIVQRLLGKGADVNTQGGEYGNALQAASYGGHDQIVRRLLEKGADVNMQGGDYGNALQAASTSGHDHIVQWLLEKGADVNMQGGVYDNALQAAAAEGHDRIVQQLLNKGADTNMQNKRHGNALQAASIQGYDQIVQQLLEKGADVDMQGGHCGNALQAASAGGHDQIVQRLLEKGANVNAQGGWFGNALQAASFRGHDQIVQLLLEKGADVNVQGGQFGSALQAASFRGYDSTVRQLLEKGADVNAQGGEFGNALQAASVWGHYCVVQQLLEKGAGVNSQDGEETINTIA